MSRSDLVLHLAALVARHAITQAQAAALLADFDSGELDEADLPSMGTPTSDRKDWLLALALVLLLTGGNTNRKLSTAKRRQARNTLRNGYQATVQQLAVGVASGAVAVGAWQGQMQAQIANYTRQMAVAGAGTLPSATTQAAVEAKLAEQWPFLQTFAVQIAARQAGAVAGSGGGASAPTVTGGPISAAIAPAKVATGGPLSAVAIAARSNQYGGIGWGSFFAGQGNDAGYGIVDVWFTRDDGHVCPRCGPRHGQYFQVGAGPYPGWDCFGSCRCERRPEYLPEIYVQLGGLAVAPAQAQSRVSALLPPGNGGSGGNPRGAPPPQGNAPQPLGIPVSVRLTLPLVSPDRVALREAMAAIDSVHGDGDLAIIQLVHVRGEDFEAAYSRRGTKAVKIEMNMDSNRKQLALVHETGHWLDHQQIHIAMGIQNDVTIERASQLVRDSMRATEQFRQWEDFVAGRRRIPVTDPLDGIVKYYKPKPPYVRYLMQGDEMWARAYAQYVSTRSQSPGLWQEFAAYRARAGGIEYWGDTDFFPVRDAIDELMKAMRWQQ